MARKSQGFDLFLRLSAGLLGALPIAWYAGLGLARWLPAAEEWRAAAGYFAPLPLYVCVGCLVVRASNGRLAWLSCILLAGALKLALVLL